MKGQCWAFSGIDGAGKTTQIELFLQDLQKRRIPAKRIWARVGYTPMLDWIRKCVRSSSPKLLPSPGKSVERDRRFQSDTLRKIWLTVAMLDFFLYLGVWVRVLHFLGFSLVFDRSVEDSTLDLELNFPIDKPSTWKLWRLVTFFCLKPEKHFLFLISVEESLKRSKQKNEPFPDDQETLEKRLSAYENFLKIGKMIEVDGLNSIEIVQSQIRSQAGFSS